MRLVATALRSKFLLLSALSVGIVVVFNYQYTKWSITKHAVWHAGDIIEKDQTLSGDLRRLQIEINETFRRFEERERVTGKAFEQAALYRPIWRKQRRKEHQLMKQDFQPPSPDCKQKPFLLIQIHSTPANFKEREAIRVSWGTPENSINKANVGKQRLWKTVFLIGQTHNPKLDELLRDEARLNEDLVFGDFTDSYRNLTNKMALGIQWAAKHCQAQYVMKADDDCFVNIHELIPWLKEYQRKQRDKPLYMGAALIDREPYREPESQFYVSENEYPEKKYPPYASGGGYVFSGKLLAQLSKALKVVRLFPNEDACFGALMQYIKVNVTNDDRFIPFTTAMAIYWEYEGHSLCQFNGPLVIHRISGKLQIQTYFNVLILKHVPTICEHIKSGIGYTDYRAD